jgi:6-pyruvoyltetrahydropterin/6-carboxytetrahydropterin synthase
VYQITKEFTFSAAHHLVGLPETHQCARVHGHNYRVRVILADRKLNEVGFVRDYGELDPIREWLKNSFDHRDLNKVLIGVNPTAENLAYEIYDRWKDDFPELQGVGVSETENTWAYYSRAIES